ncbi:MAG: enoyl-CoA hydratase/isomerase family protein [Acidimicrobiia bacterium]
MSVYDSYTTLRFARPHPGVLEVVLDNPPMNTVSVDGHREITEVWSDIARDDSVRAVLLRAEGRAFSAGGDFDLLDHIMSDHAHVARVMKEAGDLVRNIIECPQPIVSAINGVAVGAGLAAALLADIPVASRSARLLDGHVTIGVAAGDHAVVLWPLLIGMAKAKYHLLTNDPIDGTEAERLGLVAKVVDDDVLRDEATAIAVKLAESSPTAVQWTKRSLNHWLRSAVPAFDASLALEFLGWLGPDAVEGVRAVREKRPPSFE